MSFKALLTQALTGLQPIALVGGDDATTALNETASALGLRTIHIAARDVRSLANRVADHAHSKARWLIVIDDCHQVCPTEQDEHPERSLEDALLDLAFDGDPGLPANATVLLRFMEPTELSEALAEDVIPCQLLAPDMALEEPVQHRLAA